MTGFVQQRWSYDRWITLDSNKPPRDRQRQKIIDADHYGLKYAKHIPPKKQQAFVNKAVSHPDVVALWGKHEPPAVYIENWPNTASWFCIEEDGSPTIRLPEGGWGHNDMLLLHELAHFYIDLLAPDWHYECHGPEFAGAYHHLLSLFNKKCCLSFEMVCDINKARVDTESFHRAVYRRRKSVL